MTSLNKTASWVIQNKSTGECLFEIFDAKIVEKLNTNRFRAIPIGEYLNSINGKKKP